jgi:ribosomal protein S11
MLAPLVQAFDDSRNLVLGRLAGYLAGMADSIKVAEFAEVRGAFHCEHKAGNHAGVEKGQVVLCAPCSGLHAAGAALMGDGYGLRQTAFGGWVKAKAAAK